ncbi:ferredoxin [Nocardioides sp. KR10-350]|uniref:ferredoxin n=1 Tax=Nocardioides cheoyonin TaxID=3156615 RepID=UPI0032B44F16
MTIRVDPTKCRGYGLCEVLAPGHLEADDWGLAQSRGLPVDQQDVASVQAAIDVCPFDAIRWLEEPPTERSF